MSDARLKGILARVQRGGAEKYHAKNTKEGKLFARERIARLIDEGSFEEEAALANNVDHDLPADGVVTGTATVNGRTVAIMANDSTIKAGSWGWRTVEKILRIQEIAKELQCPLLYLVDSAGARITDQIQMFPGRRGAGRIFYNQVQMSGQIPQLCLLFGPSAAGGAYIPAFCDVVVMVEGNASMYLGSPRMAEMVIGEKVESMMNFTEGKAALIERSASRSTTRRYGLVGDSEITIRVLPGTMARSIASGSPGSTTVDSTPKRGSTPVTNCRVRR